MNLRSGRGSTSVGVDQGDNSHNENNGNTNGMNHVELDKPPMNHAEMMAEMLAARHESARALEMLAQAIGGFARGGPSGNGGNEGGARTPVEPYSY